MMIRGGDNPHPAMAAMPLREWTRRLGALPAEAYDCFMVRTPGFHRTQAWFAFDRGPMAGSPRIPARPTTRSPAACRRARVRQGRAFGGAEEAPSLTAAARDGDGNMRSGRKNARRRGSNKRMERLPLDNASPIQAVCGKAARTDLCGGGEQSP